MMITSNFCAWWPSTPATSPPTDPPSLEDPFEVLDDNNS